MILLKDIILILFLAIMIIIVLSRLRIPPVIGFLLTGVLIGPSALKFVKSVSDIELLAEIGVILLMFTIGLEFSLSKVRNLLNDFLLFGGLQVLFCWIAFYVLLTWYGLAMPQAVLGGFVLALSSTAIVFKLLQDGDDLSSPAGLKLTGILLFQDAAIIPVLILLPFIPQFGEVSLLSVAVDIFLAFSSVVLIYLGSKWILPKLFGLILRFGINDILMVTVVVFLFGVALLAHNLGISLAMSAFIVGVAISDSQYAHQINSDILTSRNIFNSIFFISIGMFIDISFVADHLPQVAIVTLGLIAVKILIIFLLFVFLKHPLNVGFMTAVSLAHIGEFSFIILKQAQDHSLFDTETSQLLFSAAILSMFTVPFALQIGKKISGHNKFKKELSKSEKPGDLVKHTIIAGLGVAGQNIVRILKLLGIPYLIFEINPSTVKKYRQNKEPVYYGNVDRRENLVHAGVTKASLMVIAINDMEAAKRAVSFAKSLNPAVKIIVRVNFLPQVELFYKLGADLVLSQDMETSLIFIHHILKFYNMPDHVSRIQTNILRKEHYQFFLKKEARESWKIAIFDFIEQDNELFFVSPHSRHIGKKVGELDPVGYEGIKIIGVIRKNKVLAEPSPDEVIENYDTIIFSGNHAKVAEALAWMEENN